MPDRQQLDSDSGTAPRVPTDATPEITTPVIDIQDLEHKPGPDTRVNTKGVEITPESQSPLMAELENLEKHLEKEDEKAREAVADFERQYTKLPPG